MNNPKRKIPQEFSDLPSDGRIAYVQDLWDVIAEAPNEVEVPDSHKRILDERLAAYEADPSESEPWSKVRDTILRKLRGSWNKGVSVN